MKNSILYIGLSSLLLMVSCQEEEQSVDAVIDSGKVSLMQEKRQELNKQQRLLNSKIARLSEEIDARDDVNSFSLVNVKKIGREEFIHYIEVQGDVETDKNILMYPEFSGVLDRIYVEEGDRVKKGQLLARIDDGGLSEEMEELKTKLKLSETRFERQKRLWDQNIGSEIQFLEAETSYQSLKSSQSRLQKQIDKTEIRASFAGTIDSKMVDQGQVVSPGQTPIFRLINLDESYIYAQIPEKFLNAVEVGTLVKISISSIQESFDSKIIQVANFIDPNNRKFMVKIEIPENVKNLKPNLVALIKINDYTSKEAIVISQSNLQETAGGDQMAYVFEPKDDKTGVARQIRIETGRSFHGYLEVLEGLEEGQYIITEGARSVKEGEKLRITEAVK
ncbi:MAG: efflux RND transporter periplasmic adaptor subunit [Psychroflexus sp.]